MRNQYSLYDLIKNAKKTKKIKLCLNLSLLHRPTTVNLSQTGLYLSEFLYRDSCSQLRWVAFEEFWISCVVT